VSQTSVHFRDLKTPAQFPTGDVHVITVQRNLAHLLCVENVHFHENSAVFLPDSAPEGQDPDADPNTGLALLRDCYLQAKKNPSQKLLLVGHTDTTGSRDYNFTLSKLRADGVLAALLGNREDWGRVCQAKSLPRDKQEILGWVAREFGWDCDPGDAGGAEGSRTKRAVKAFQERYNTVMDGALAVDGLVGLQTWQAFLDFYLIKLKMMLDTDDDGLADLRNQLHFVDDGKKVVGCGECHPIEKARKDSYPSTANRRVEILFFDPGQEPKLDCHPADKPCQPGVCELYDPVCYEFQRIPAEPHDRGTLRVWLMDPAQRRIKSAPYRLTIGREVRTGNADGDGLLTEANIPIHATCTIEWGAKPSQGGDYRFETTMHLRLDDDSTMSEDELAIHQLNNLGYTGGLKQMVAEFQVDNDLPEAAWFDQVTADKLTGIHDGGLEAEPEDVSTAEATEDAEPCIEPLDDDIA
jgi:hypothetical protein